MGLVVRLEAEFSGRNNGWTDITSDLATDPIRLRYGINGTGPRDRVASTGPMSFALCNFAKGARPLGYYSPNHNSKRSGWQPGIGIRLILSPEGRLKTIATSSVANPTVITTSAAHGYSTGDRVQISGHAGSTPSLNAVHAAVTVLSPTTFTIPVNVTVGGTGGTVQRKNLYYKFSGSLDVIRPAAGLYGDLTVQCVALDWMNDAAKRKITGLTTQTNIASDDAFSALIAASPVQPRAIEVQAGQDIYQYAFDNARDESDAVLTELQRLASSELGFIYIKGDRTQGGTLVFESRRTRALSTTNLDEFLDATTDGSGITGLAVSQARDNIVNKLQVTTHPRRVDAAPTTVLARLDNPTPIGANSIITLLFPYRDPLQEAARVGGINMQAPAPFTDYAMNTASDGSGADITANFSVSPSFGGNGVRFQITNNGTVNGYITLLQARGKGVYDYQNVILEAQDADSIQNHGEQGDAIDMKYQSDPSVAAEAALYLVNLYKNPLSHVQSGEWFVPYSDGSLGDRLLRREISDRIGITERVTGIAPGTRHLGFFINAVDLTIDQRNNMTCSFLLAPADRTSYWQLEVPGQTELDQSTILGFGQIVGHTDVPHCDTHDDTAHSDVAHSDTTHLDTAHADAGHTDSAHADVVHGDAHADSAHSDAAHSDVAHSDSHSDGAHSDTAHGDTTHEDIGHGDSYDFADVPAVHSDAFFNHVDIAFADVPHDDSHTDVAHSDAHSDDAHGDTAHDDVAHGDVAHSDSLHSDVAHGDGGHADAGHSDVAHADVNHADITHIDDHCDVTHGDA
jgi:hypothetical protein